MSTTRPAPTTRATSPPNSRWQTRGRSMPAPWQITVASCAAIRTASKASTTSPGAAPATSPAIRCSSTATASTRPTSARSSRCRPAARASATGPNGLDMGALVPAGASISGEPSGSTSETSASLTIAGPGIWSYRWRLNGGAWSEEISLVPQAIWDGARLTDTTVRQRPADRTQRPGRWDLHSRRS